MYQLATDYANKLCHKKCYDIVDECQEYILERISRNGMSRLKSYKGLSSESTFAYVVVNNLIKDFLKTKKSVVSFDEMTEHSFSTDILETSSKTEDNLIKNDENKIIEETLKTLKLEDQLIIKLRYFDEYPVYVRDGAIIPMNMDYKNARPSCNFFFVKN